MPEYRVLSQLNEHVEVRVDDFEERGLARETRVHAIGIEARVRTQHVRHECIDPRLVGVRGHALAALRLGPTRLLAQCVEQRLHSGEAAHMRDRHAVVVQRLQDPASLVAQHGAVMAVLARRTAIQDVPVQEIAFDKAMEDAVEQVHGLDFH
ncbi:hypothetical protein [Burkholderia humptydooensis]|uniref:hypothetical protein n=1 Tax=Burkholderia humptydooensis TaxID=430531 RepID=UPI001E475CCE|nr:hypothetical protein [Burkholderia humptydooensis]